MVEDIALVGILQSRHQVQVTEVLIPGQCNVGRELSCVGDIIARNVGPHGHRIDFAVDSAIAGVKAKAIGHLP